MWKDKLRLGVACCLPQWLVYWSFIRLVAFATTGKYQKTDTFQLTCIEALRRWEEQ